MAEKWKLSGSYFESCNCEAACSCIFLSPPDDGECNLLVAWHIGEGNYGNVGLNGLNMVLAVKSPGHMAEVKWQVAVYMDETATPEQADALTNIFTGQAGGHFEALASHIGEVLGLASAAIEFNANGKTRTMKVAGIAAVEIEAIGGQGGNDVTVSNHPLCIAPGYPAVVAKSKQFSYDDHGCTWEFSNKNAFYSPFSYEGA